MSKRKNANKLSGRNKIILSSAMILITLFLWPDKMTAQDSLIFVIRVDDIMNRSTTILPRSIEPFEKMANARQAKITWAVIPHRLIEKENQDGRLRRELIASKQNGHEISQHGYNHFCQICNSWNHEMRCSAQNKALSYDAQASLVRAGLRILADSLATVPTTFVPPGHSADTCTYRVLLDHGFTGISTTEATKTCLPPGLYNLASHSEYTWALTAAQYQTKMQQALQDIRSVGRAQGYYCLLLHDYFIRSGYENGVVIQWTGELLDSLRAEYGDRIQFKTLTEAIDHFTKKVAHAGDSVEHPPVLMALGQNYPNPFNARTTISFRLDQSMPVRLAVYNATGQMVRLLIDDFKTPGEHHLSIHLDELASGIYFYRLTAGDYSEQRKCLLLK